MRINLRANPIMNDRMRHAPGVSLLLTAVFLRYLVFYFYDAFLLFFSLLFDRQARFLGGFLFYFFSVLCCQPFSLAACRCYNNSIARPVRALVGCLLDWLLQLLLFVATQQNVRTN